MSCVIAQGRGGTGGARVLAQEVEGNLGAQQLDDGIAEATRGPQAEGAGVERFGARQVVDVDVDQELHGHLRADARGAPGDHSACGLPPVS